MTRLTLRELHDDIGIGPEISGYGEVFGPKSKKALFKRISNKRAPALIMADYTAAAERLGVPVGHIRGVRKVEAPRGPFDDEGRPSILYERHVFARNCDPKGRFNQGYPILSASRGYGPGGYGGFGEQYERLAAACALDPEAAFRACSWGAFQVLGENAVALGYPSAYEMAKSLTVSEAAHLETFVRFIECNNLIDEFKACRPDSPSSCVAFVRRYNGEAYRRFNYHVKLAAAI